MKKTFKRDWRRSKDYEELKTYSLEKWAWEFLRRNPDYCREYRELTEGLTEIQTLQAAFNPGCRKWDLLTWLNPDRGYSNIPFIPPGEGRGRHFKPGLPEGERNGFLFCREAYRRSFFPLRHPEANKPTN